MADLAQTSAVRRSAWRTAWDLTKFGYSTFIAPWPPFAIFMAVTAIISAVVPSGLVFATSRLIDAVAEQAAGGDLRSEPLVGLVSLAYHGWFCCCS